MVSSKKPYGIRKGMGRNRDISRPARVFGPKSWPWSARDATADGVDLLLAVEEDVHHGPVSMMWTAAPAPASAQQWSGKCPAQMVFHPESDQEPGRRQGTATAAQFYTPKQAGAGPELRT